MRVPMIAIGLALITPAVQAQASRDLAYCERLYEMHDRYVARVKRFGGTARDGMADAAIDRCRNGRFGEGIPVLELKLAQAKIPLPDR